MAEYAFITPWTSTASKAERAGALSEDGPIGIGTAHILHKLMPDAIDPTASSSPACVTAHLLDWLFVPAAILCTSIKRGATHWALEPDRCSQWLHDLVEAGMDTSPVAGNLADAAAILQRRVLSSAAKLPAAKRQVGEADIIFDSTKLDDPATGSFYDFVTPALLTGADKDNILLAQFKALTVCSYNADDRKSDAFVSYRKQWLAAVGRDISALEGMSQAAEVASRVRATRQPKELEQYA